MREKTEAFIVDVDGTLALHTEAERGHFEYDKVIKDRPNHHVIWMVRLIAASGLYPVIMSGRADDNGGAVRVDTHTWLNHHVGLQRYELVMRPERKPNGERDFRKDDVVKKELYYNLVEPRYDVYFAIDDRPRVLRMWHEIGIPTFAVGTPWIEF